MTHGRRMCIPSPFERASNHILGASYCFRSSYWAFPKGAASFVPVLMSRTSPSTWRPPPPRRPAPFAGPTRAAYTAGTPADSTTCPVSAGVCDFGSPYAASCVHSPTAPAASLPSNSRGSPRRGHGRPTGSARHRPTSARPWAVRPAPASPHVWRNHQPDTLLRRVKRLKNEPVEPPWVVGIDARRDYRQLDHLAFAPGYPANRSARGVTPSSPNRWPVCVSRPQAARSRRSRRR